MTSNIHKQKHVNEYIGHIAAYPNEFQGVVVREDNMCLQFCPTVVTYRKHPSTEGQLELHQDVLGTKNIRLCTNGTQIQTLAVRVTYEILEQMLKEVIKGLKEKDKLDIIKRLTDANK